jgi:hypothetical protein
MLLISRATKWCRKNRTSTTTMTATIATTTSAAAACLPTGSFYYARRRQASTGLDRQDECRAVSVICVRRMLCRTDRPSQSSTAGARTAPGQKPYASRTTEPAAPAT